MKKLTIILAFIFAGMHCIGQQIDKAEYFIDSDPGYGLATPVQITIPGRDLSLSFQVNTSGLSQGFHMMVLRARDDMGRWSTTRQQPFYVYEVQNVTDSKIDKAEYFIDNDPGFGSAIPVPITIPGKDLSISFQVNSEGLSQGFHTMVLRARNELGRWSTTRQQVFYVYEVLNITESKINKAEYIIDIDPGFGMGIAIPVTIPGKDLSLSFQVNSDGLSQGFHTIVMRALDERGRWSNTRQQVFYLYKSIPAASLNIIGIEYFIDTDPGFGKGTPVDIASPGSKVTVDFIADLNGFTSGDHVLYFRSKDALNRWSQTYAHAFSMTVTDVDKKEVMPWFRMYPNPNGGNFIMDFTELQTSQIKITINDLNGRKVYSDELYGETISLSLDLPTGIYVLKVEAGNKSFLQKLIINR